MKKKHMFSCLFFNNYGNGKDGNELWQTWQPLRWRQVSNATGHPTVRKSHMVNTIPRFSSSTPHVPFISPSPTVSHLKPTYIYIYVFKTSPSSLTCFNFPNSPRNHPPHIPIFLVVTSTPSAFPRSVFSAMAATASAASFSAMLSFLPGPRPQAQLSQLQMRRLLLT